MIDYNIISTGSRGNAVILDKYILIDCGVSFRALQEHYNDLKLVLLTHRHGDHFNAKTIRRLAHERPALRFGCRPWLVKPLVECGVSKYSIDIYSNGTDNYYGEKFPVSVESFDLLHNVENCGYKIRMSDMRILYATDTNSMSGIEAKNYDLYMLEANYDEREITERIRLKQSNGEHCYEWNVLKNHLSREKAEDFIYRNIGANGQYVFLHQHDEVESFGNSNG